MPQISPKPQVPHAISDVGTILRRAAALILTNSSRPQATEDSPERSATVAITGLRLACVSRLSPENIAEAEAIKRGVSIVVIVKNQNAKAHQASSDEGSPRTRQETGPFLSLDGKVRTEAADAAGRASTAAHVEAHAHTRWAEAVVRIVSLPRDPRTLSMWGRSIGVSAGALRNWCRTAGIRSRHSLLLGRLLRAVVLYEGGQRQLENVLDVVDKRTLRKLVDLAGLSDQKALSCTVSEFLSRQALVRDPEALKTLQTALEQHRTEAKASPSPDPRAQACWVCELVWDPTSR